MKIIVNRMGYSGDSTNVTLTPTSNIDSVNFVLSRITIGIRKIENTIPTEYKLFQNYPNPFNPTTNIKYSIPSNVNRQSSNVKLVVFDILGKVVATLVNENQSPGVYEVSFNAGSLPSGVYFYKLTAGDYTEVKKLVLLK
ncbi:MAG: T9SS type A sorting domain-containing protein [Ignavibacteriae bacterium]|nr:T9SS type A sorting domain-containing protein [Ignavibacteriota bacterium]